jgi:hypothetical protein
MGNGSGVSRGDRNRNARLERLRALVPVSKLPAISARADPDRRIPAVVPLALSGLPGECPVAVAPGLQG